MKYVSPKVVSAGVPPKQEITPYVLYDYALALGAPLVNIPKEVRFDLYTAEAKATKGGNAVELKPAHVKGTVRPLKIRADVQVDLLNASATIYWKALYGGSEYFVDVSKDDEVKKVVVAFLGFADSDGTSPCCSVVKVFDKSEVGTSLEVDLSGLKGASSIGYAVYVVDKAADEVLSGATEEELANFVLAGLWHDAITGEAEESRGSALEFFVSRLELLATALGASWTNLEKVREAVEAVGKVWRPLRSGLATEGLVSFKNFFAAKLTSASFEAVTFGSPAKLGAVEGLLSRAYEKLYGASTSLSLGLDKVVELKKGSATLMAVSVESLLKSVSYPKALAVEALADYYTKRSASDEALVNVLKSLAEVLTTPAEPLRLAALLEDGTALIMYTPPKPSLAAAAADAIEELQFLPLGVKKVSVYTPLAILDESVSEVRVEVMREGKLTRIRLERSADEAVNEAFKARLGVSAEEYAAKVGTSLLYVVFAESPIGRISFVVPKGVKEVEVESRLLSLPLRRMKVAAVSSAVYSYYAADPKLSVSISSLGDVEVTAKFVELGYVKALGADLAVYGIAKVGNEFDPFVVSVHSESGAVNPFGSGTIYVSGIVKESKGVKEKYVKDDQRFVKVQGGAVTLNLSAFLRQVEPNAEVVMLMARTEPLFAFSSGAPLATKVYVNDSVLPKVYRVAKPTEDLSPAYITVKGNVTMFVVPRLEYGRVKAAAEPLSLDISTRSSMKTYELKIEAQSKWDVKVDEGKAEITLYVPKDVIDNLYGLDLSFYSKDFNVPVNVFDQPSYSFFTAVQRGAQLLAEHLDEVSKYEDLLGVKEEGFEVRSIKEVRPDLYKFLRDFGASDERDLFVKVGGSYYSMKFEVLPTLFLLLLTRQGIGGWGVEPAPEGFAFSKALLKRSLESLVVTPRAMDEVMKMSVVIEFFVDTFLSEAAKRVRDFFGYSDQVQIFALLNKMKYLRLRRGPTKITLVKFKWPKLKLVKGAKKAEVAFEVELDGDEYQTSVELESNVSEAEVDLAKAALQAYLGAIDARLADAVKDAEDRGEVVKRLWEKAKELGLASELLTNYKLLSIVMSGTVVPDRVKITTDSWAVFVPPSSDKAYAEVEGTWTAAQGSAEGLMTFSEDFSEVAGELEKELKGAIEDFLSGNEINKEAIVYFSEPVTFGSELKGWSRADVVIPFRALIRVNTQRLKDAFNSGDLGNEGVLKLFPSQTAAMLDLEVERYVPSVTAPFVTERLVYPVTSELAPVPVLFTKVKRAVAFDPFGAYRVCLVGKCESYVTYRYLGSGGELVVKKYALNVNSAEEVDKDLPEGVLYVKGYGGEVIMELAVTNTNNPLFSVKVEGKRAMVPGIAVYDYTKIRRIDTYVPKSGLSVAVTLNVKDHSPEPSVAFGAFLTFERKWPKSDVCVSLDSEEYAVPIKITEVRSDSGPLSLNWVQNEAKVALGVPTLTFVKKGGVIFVNAKLLPQIRPTAKVVLSPFSKNSDKMTFSASFEFVKSPEVWSAVSEGMEVEAYLIASSSALGYTNNAVLKGALEAQQFSVAYEEPGKRLYVRGLKVKELVREAFTNEHALPDTIYAEFMAYWKGEAYKTYVTNAVALPSPVVSVKEEAPGTWKVKVDSFGYAKKVMVGALTGIAWSSEGIVPSFSFKCLTPLKDEMTIKAEPKDYSAGIVSINVGFQPIKYLYITGKKASEPVVLSADGHEVLLVVPELGAVVELKASSKAKEYADAVVEFYKNASPKAADKFAAAVSAVESGADAGQYIRELAEELGVKEDVVSKVVELASKASMYVPPVNLALVKAYFDAIKTDDGFGTSAPIAREVSGVTDVVLYSYDLSVRTVMPERVSIDEVSLNLSMEGGEECSPILALKRSLTLTGLGPVVSLAESLADASLKLTKNDPKMNLALVAGLLALGVAASRLS